MAQIFSSRAQADPQFTWDLSVLYPNDAAWEAGLEEARGLTEQAAGFAGRMGESGETLLACLRCNDALSAALDRLGNYARRKADEDTRDPVYQQMSARFMALAVEAGQALAYQTPELLAIPDDRLDSFYAECPALEGYRRAIERERRMREHILSPGEEKLLAAAGQLAQTPDEVFSMLNDADLRFPDALDREGKAHPVTHGSFVPLLQSPDRTLRKNAFTSLYGVYGGLRNTSAAVLTAQMRQLKFFADARKYESPLHAALDGTEVPVEIYHNLIAAVRRNLPALHRYVELRRKVLGVERLHYYDLYTPIVPDEDIEMPYEDAKKLALEALAPMGENYLALLREGFAGRWIDVYENTGKRSGAYSAGAYGAHPFVLLNYSDTLDDAFTLVHEMGHALHSYLSNTTQPVTYADYVIFVAEVASTCNESLLMQHLLAQPTTPRRRAYLLNHFLEQFRGTLYRQTMFAEFELWCSEQVQAGQALTAEALCEQYAALCRDYYGPAVEPDPEIALEWARIPHFYYDFYVYQYATGFSAAIALSQRILREGQPAVEDYLNFLRGGCSADPVTLLRGAGVDMASPAPVDDALALFSRLVEELEQALEQA